MAEAEEKPSFEAEQAARSKGGVALALIRDAIDDLQRRIWDWQRDHGGDCECLWCDLPVRWADDDDDDWTMGSEIYEDLQCIDRVLHNLAMTMEIDLPKVPPDELRRLVVEHGIRQLTEPRQKDETDRLCRRFRDGDDWKNN